MGGIGDGEAVGIAETGLVEKELMGVELGRLLVKPGCIVLLCEGISHGGSDAVAAGNVGKVEWIEEGTCDMLLLSVCLLVIIFV